MGAGIFIDIDVRTLSDCHQPGEGAVCPGKSLGSVLGDVRDFA
jgi:hypothetical protein